MEKLVVPPISVVAKDAQTAALKALQGKTIDLERAKVLVRPFA